MYVRTDGQKNGRKKQDKANSLFVQLCKHVQNVHFSRRTNMYKVLIKSKLTYLLLPVIGRLILCTMFNLFKNDVVHPVIVCVIVVFYVGVNL
jgi:hypothetical protein